LSEIIINLEGIDPVEFYGVNNAKLTLLKNAFPKLKIVSRGTKIKVDGNDEEIERFEDKIGQMIDMTERFGYLSDKSVQDLLQTENGTSESYEELISDDDVLVHGRNGLLVKAKTKNQRAMVKMSERNDILFAMGPAGTGKTYTAVALAVRALKAKVVKKIILTRPAVEAGESLGFLPGDLKEKIDPYLRPLYDALDDMLPVEKLTYYMSNRIIEVAPLAYMRGRTLDHSFIILDEAQNTTSSQLKMFLTRIGPSAKCIVTGDMTQIDLPRNQKSGLQEAINILKNINGIGTIYLEESDVVRHRLVKHIIKAYIKLSEDQTEKENKDSKKSSD
jgi:phosphate starvation-inducible protein PhoH and related proteins